MEQVRKLAPSRMFFYASETDQPFGHEDLLDEDKEESLPGLQDEGVEETEQRQRWMAPSLFGDMFRTVTGNNPDVEAEMDDEISRRGGRPQEANSQQFSTAMKKDATSALQQSNLDFTGTFEKRSPWWVEGWRPRSFLLKDGKLLYFEKHRKDRPLGVLDFSLVSYEVHCCWAEADAAEEEQRRACDVCSTPTPEDYVTFFLRPPDYPQKVFAFRGPVEDMKVLAAKIAGLVRRQHALLQGIAEERAVMTAKNFWRYPYVREADFRDCAECGDILLFRGTGRRCQLIRCVSLGKYDHVALLLKTASGSLLVLEATGTDGVSLIPWKNFVGWGWHKCYERIAFRKVYFDRDTVQMEKLQQYVHSIIGASYSLTTDKIFKKKNSFSFDDRGYDNTPESMRPSAGGANTTTASYFAPDGSVAPGPDSFFCSELVAACLKRCGVLAGIRASATYWPSSFSQYDMESLPLHEGVHIGGDQTIVFD